MHLDFWPWCGTGSKRVKVAWPSGDRTRVKSQALSRHTRYLADKIPRRHLGIHVPIQELNCAGGSCFDQPRPKSCEAVKRTT